MTVSAFNLLAVLPGAPPSPTGTGVAASSDDGGLFEGLLAGAIQAEQGGWLAAGGASDDQHPAEVANTDETGPAIDAGTLLLMFAPAAAPIPAPLAPSAAPAPSGIIEAEAPATAPAAAGWGETTLSASRPPVVLAPVANDIAGALGPVTTGPATPGDAVDLAMPDEIRAPDGAGRAGDLAGLIARAGQRDSAPARTAPVGPVAPPPATAAAQAAMQSAPLAPVPVAPVPVAPPLVAPTASATVDDVEAVEVAGVTLPPPGSVKAGPTEGEGRRAPGAARAERRDGATRVGAASTSPFSPKADLLATSGAISTSPTTEAADAASEPATDLAALDTAEAPETRQPALIAEARAQATQATTAAIDAAAVRGSPETVAKMAADIVRKLDGQSTRFDLQLDPVGMGKVDVAIEIDQAGKLTAAMSFDSAQSASDLRGRAGELRLALEQAGFDIAEGGLTFDLSGHGAGLGGREAGQQERAWSGRAFQRAQSGADDADLSLAATPSTPLRWTRSGVDIRI